MDGIRKIQSNRCVVLTFAAFLFCFLVDARSFAQEEVHRLTRVEWSALRDEVVISYDLEGDASDTYVVSIVLLRESDKVFRFKPILVTGKIGKGKFSGKNNEIYWAFKKDFPLGFEGDDYYFELNVEKPEGFPWLIAAGGAAIAGIAIVLASQPRTPGPPPVFQLPYPPPRP